MPAPRNRDFEQLVLYAVRAVVSTPPSDRAHTLLRRRGLAITKVSLKGSYPETLLVFLFRADERPECTFGFRRPLWACHPQLRVTPAMPGPPDESARNFVADVAERVSVWRLPPCNEATITWLASEVCEIDRHEYAERAVAALRRRYRPEAPQEHFRGAGDSCAVADVYVELQPTTRICVLLRDADQPDCLFGLRIPLWDRGRPVLDTESPEHHAWLLAVNLEEFIESPAHGLPHDCRPGEITWVSSL